MARPERTALSPLIRTKTMLILTVALLGALCSAGLAFWRAPQVPRYWPLLAIAVAPQFGNLFGIAIPGMFFAAIIAVLIWCFGNWHIPGALLIALGVGLNWLVMALHGGSMPIRADVLALIGQAAPIGTQLAGSKDVVVQTSLLWWLSDWIVISAGSKILVVSPGDLVIVGGILYWLVFSRQLKKDSAYVEISRNPDAVGTAHPSAARAK